MVSVNINSCSVFQISELSVVPNAVSLDLSSNGLTRIYGEWPLALEDLNLSNNPSLEQFSPLSLIPQLSDLNMDNCGLTVWPVSTLSNLRHLSLQYNGFAFIDFDSLELPSLQKVCLFCLRYFVQQKVKTQFLIESKSFYLPVLY